MALATSVAARHYTPSCVLLSGFRGLFRLAPPKPFSGYCERQSKVIVLVQIDAAVLHVKFDTIQFARLESVQIMSRLDVLGVDVSYRGHGQS
jgi:hypothetical protein